MPVRKEAPIDGESVGSKKRPRLDTHSVIQLHKADWFIVPDREIPDTVRNQMETHDVQAVREWCWYHMAHHHVYRKGVLDVTSQSRLYILGE